MRVVGGKAKGRKLKTLAGDDTRPILQRVRTSLFDILRPTLDGKRILDLFAGSGSVGIEALSQGASHCTFIDIGRKATEIVKDNLKHTELEKDALVLNTDAFKFLRNTDKAFDLIYIAPPQYKSLWVEAMRSIAERPELLTEGGEIIVQIDPKEYEKIELTAFEETQERRYGNTLLIFYKLRV